MGEVQLETLSLGAQLPTPPPKPSFRPAPVLQLLFLAPRSPLATQEGTGRRASPLGPVLTVPPPRGTGLLPQPLPYRCSAHHVAHLLHLAGLDLGHLNDGQAAPDGRRGALVLIVRRGHQMLGVHAAVMAERTAGFTPRGAALAGHCGRGCHLGRIDETRGTVHELISSRQVLQGGRTKMEGLL